MVPVAERVDREAMVLGIETSCDETGVGLVRGHTLLADAPGRQVHEPRPRFVAVPDGRPQRPERAVVSECVDGGR